MGRTLLSSTRSCVRTACRAEHIQADLGATVAYVTHDQVEALTMASRIGISSRGASSRSVRAGRLRAACEHLRSSDTGHPRRLTFFHRRPTGRRRAAADRYSWGAHRAHRARARARRSGRGGPGEHLGSENFLHLLVGQQKLVTLVPPGALASGRGRGDAASPACFDTVGQLLVA